MRIHVPCRELALLAAALIALGCTTKKKEEGPDAGARTLVDDLRAAAEDRNADVIGLRLNGDFRGTGGIDRAQALETLKRYFTAYQTLRVDVSDVDITRPSSRIADVRCRVEFRGTAKRVAGMDALLPPTAVYRVDLHVIWPMTPDWMVQTAEWQPIEAKP
jgi:hypothetical protein